MSSLTALGHCGVSGDISVAGQEVNSGLWDQAGEQLRALWGGNQGDAEEEGKAAQIPPCRPGEKISSDRAELRSGV